MFSYWSTKPKKQQAPESRSMATQTSRRTSSASESKSMPAKTSRQASLASSSASTSAGSIASVGRQRAAFDRSNSITSVSNFDWKPSFYYASSVERRELDYELELEIHIDYESLKTKKNGDWLTFQHGTDQYKRTLNPRYIAENMGIRDKHTSIEIGYIGAQSPLEQLLLATSDSTRFLRELQKLAYKLSGGKGSLDGYRRAPGEHYGLFSKPTSRGPAFTDRAHVILDFQASGFYTRSRSENVIFTGCRDLDFTFSLSQIVRFKDPEWDRREPEMYSEVLKGYCLKNGTAELHRAKQINRYNNDEAAGTKLLKEARKAGFDAGKGGIFFSVMRSAKDSPPSRDKSVAGLDEAKKAFARRVGLIDDHKGNQADSSFTWWSRSGP